MSQIESIQQEERKRLQELLRRRHQALHHSKSSEQQELDSFIDSIRISRKESEPESTSLDVRDVVAALAANCRKDSK